MYDIVQLLGAGGMSDEYMKIRSDDTFTDIQRNIGQTCATTVDIEDLSEKYFPRFCIVGLLYQSIIVRN